MCHLESTTCITWTAATNRRPCCVPSHRMRRTFAHRSITWDMSRAVTSGSPCSRGNILLAKRGGKSLLSFCCDSHESDDKVHFPARSHPADAPGDSVVAVSWTPRLLFPPHPPFSRPPVRPPALQTAINPKKNPYSHDWRARWHGKKKRHAQDKNASWRRVPAAVCKMRGNVSPRQGNGLASSVFGAIS